MTSVAVSTLGGACDAKPRNLTLCERFFIQTNIPHRNIVRCIFFFFHPFLAVAHGAAHARMGWPGPAESSRWGTSDTPINAPSGDGGWRASAAKTWGGFRARVPYAQGDANDYFRFLNVCGFRKRTPSPPPLSSMKSIPAFSNARRMAASFACVTGISPATTSALRIVATPTFETRAKSRAVHRISARAARI
jgi:hypothetical protein